MTLAGISLPEGVTALATTGSQPFLAVTTSGLGRAVQWGTYDWMSQAVKGPVYGLDDLVWRSIVWAARKPFTMQGLPPFVTMRMDDEYGPFWWVDIANEFGIKPWISVFYRTIDRAEAKHLSTLVREGKATVSIHGKTVSEGFYYEYGVGAMSDEDVAANFEEGTAWHADRKMPISNVIVPHLYELGANVFHGLSDWDVEFVITMMEPGTPYGSPWITGGPYRLYEPCQSSQSMRPLHYADFIKVPGHPEFDGQFFHCVTEMRDDVGSEWFPSNDVAGSIDRGTWQVKRALDSMVLATLHTHRHFVADIGHENWRAMLRGITDNLAPYHPTYVSLDYACQYVRAVYTSDIVGGEYDPDMERVTVTLGGAADMPTEFYLFIEQEGEIRHMLIDVPAFSGSTEVAFTLTGPLDHLVITPSSTTVAVGNERGFTAEGYDADGHPIPNLPLTWSVVSGEGTIDADGLFVAKDGAGGHLSTVQASSGDIVGRASVKVVAPVWKTALRWAAIWAVLWTLVRFTCAVL
jgi:hypothetical protein